MRIVGLLRVKNESRWITQVIESIKPLCSHIVIFDDHSEDDTVAICRSLGTDVIPSPYPPNSLLETRDKNRLLIETYKRYGPFTSPTDYAIMIDGDEILTPDSIPSIRRTITNNPGYSFKLRILYLWNNLSTVRTDGVYGRPFVRPSIFPLTPHPSPFSSPNKAGFHCSNIPSIFFPKCKIVPATLLHLGYMLKEDRLRKFYWYREKDPGNIVEQGYIHMVQGDIPSSPADKVFNYGGPLTLRPLQDFHLSPVAIPGMPD